jgi:DNA-binding NarL/FixJ family response regulator
MSNALYGPVLQDMYRFQSANGVVMIRLLIVEDRPGVGQGLRMLLDAEADLSVVGEAADSTAALALTAALGPDVVLMDVEQRRMDGIATTAALHQAFPRIPIIMLSIHDDAGTRARADGAGAATFVSKLMPAEVLVVAIRQVAHGWENASVAPVTAPYSNPRRRL